MVRVVNEEESQKKLSEKDMENKLLYIGKDAGTAKETMQQSLVTMMKQLNLHLRNVRQYVNESASAEGNQGDNMAMDDDVLLNQGDQWMEFGDEEREKMLRAIAHAREITNNELNHAYDKWEEFQDKKSVARETRVQNDKVYAEIQKAKEYKNKDNDVNILHDQVTSLTKAFNCLMKKILGTKNSSHARRNRRSRSISTDGDKSRRLEKGKRKDKDKNKRKGRSISTSTKRSISSKSSMSTSTRTSKATRSTRGEKRKRDTEHKKGPNHKHKKREQRNGKRGKG